jgi:hypothetical protein
MLSQSFEVLSCTAVPIGTVVPHLKAPQFEAREIIVPAPQRRKPNRNSATLFSKRLAILRCFIARQNPIASFL